MFYSFSVLFMQSKCEHFNKDLNLISCTHTHPSQPHSNDRRHSFRHVQLGISLSLHLSVPLSTNFNIACNIWHIQEELFLFGLHMPCVKLFQMSSVPDHLVILTLTQSHRMTLAGCHSIVDDLDTQDDPRPGMIFRKHRFPSVFKHVMRSNYLLFP